MKRKEKEGQVKRKSIWLFFLKMLLLFILVNVFVIELLTLVLSGFIGDVLSYGKYSKDFILEICAFILLCLIVIRKSKKFYIFKEKSREKLGKSLLRAWPAFLIAFVQFLFGLYQIIFVDKYINIYSLISCALLCGCVGLFEEFLCRGWLQNEFIERYGDNHKNVIKSIILSSLVFGIMHITNVFAGQTLFETLAQVFNAIAMGIFFGTIYYRTKNIWSVVLIHGIYDFMVFFPEINLIKDCSTNYMPDELRIIIIIEVMLFAFVYIISSLRLLQKEDVYKAINNEEKLEVRQNKRIYNVLIIIGLVLSYAAAFKEQLIDQNKYENMTTCFSYDNTSLENYEIRYIYKNKFLVKNRNVELELFTEDKSLVILDNKTTKKTVIFENISDFEIYKNNDNYEIAILKKDGDNDVLLYSNSLIDNLTYDEQNNLQFTYQKIIVPDECQLGYIVIDEINYPYIIDGVNNRYFIKNNRVIRIK